MFSIPDLDFMTNNMKIDVSSIESKLNEPFIIEIKHIAKGAVEKFIKALKDFEASGKERELYSCEDNAAEKYINSHAIKLSESIQNQAAKQVLDALRYTFSCYAYNGLHQLYTRQENQCWHPKVRLTEVLTPNDIDSLDPMITLYRGCRISELESGMYGQAWTTLLKVAEDFAYIHYQSQDWFNSDDRVVLETIYSRKHVLFSNQSVEFEVVVDVNRLVNVRKHT